MPTPKILAFAGSTRTASWNKRLVRAAAASARDAGGEVTLVDLRDFPMPLYDGDDEQRDGLPPAAQELKHLFVEHHGLLISTPEYNGGYSAVLKNSIDWVSRRAAKDEPALVAFRGKVAGIMAASPGKYGGVRSLMALRQILSQVGMLVVPQQLALGNAADAFGEDDTLVEPGQQAAIAGIASRVVTLLQRLGD